MSMDEIHLEAEIKAKGLTAPRITPEHVDAQIFTEAYYVFPGTAHTVCCLTLVNGHTVIGESAAVSLANFDEGIGRRLARANARDKIWALEAFLLRDRMYQSEKQIRDQGYSYR